MSQHAALRNNRAASEIRDVQFTRRMRGLDEFEVDEFLEVLAVQVEATDRVLRRLGQENQRLRARTESLETENRALRAENDRLTAGPSRTSAAAPEATPRAATLLRSAQTVADALLEEAVARTRELLAEAQAEVRTRLREAEVDAASGPLDLHWAPASPPVAARRSWQLDKADTG